MSRWYTIVAGVAAGARAAVVAAGERAGLGAQRELRDAEGLVLVVGSLRLAKGALLALEYSRDAREGRGGR